MHTLETDTERAKSRGTARPKGNKSHKTTPQCCSMESGGLDAYTNQYIRGSGGLSKCVNNNNNKADKQVCYMDYGGN